MGLIRRISYKMHNDYSNYACLVYIESNSYSCPAHAHTVLPVGVANYQGPPDRADRVRVHFCVMSTDYLEG